MSTLKKSGIQKEVGSTTKYSKDDGDGIIWKMRFALNNQKREGYSKALFFSFKL